VRGFAHLGVLSALERMRVPIGRIVGTSMGAVVGLAYAFRPDAAALTERMLDRTKEISRASWLSPIMRLVGSILKPEKRMIAELKELFGTATFDNCLVDAAAVAVDLKCGDVVTITEGSLWRAAYSSAAVPGVYSPETDAEKLLTDGGVLAMIPVKEARRIGGKRIVAVDVGRNLGPMSDSPSAGEVRERIRRLVEQHLTRAALEDADLVLRPDVGRFAWNEFEHAEECVEAGRSAVEEAESAIARLTSFWSWLPWWTPREWGDVGQHRDSQ
jgi:NTE family protein